MRSISLRFLFLIAFVQIIPKTQAADTVYVLDFSSNATLKMVFDAGLRPTRVSDSPVEDKCEVRDCSVIFIGKGGLRVPMEAEQVVFDIAADNTLQKILAVGRNLNADSALREAAQSFAPFGGPPANLQQAFQEARRTRSFEVLREVGRGTAIDAEPAIGVGFMPGDFVLSEPGELHVRIVVSLYWKSNMVRKKLRKEPIKPPAGYEQFSMEPVLSPSEVRRQRDIAAIAAAQSATPLSSTPVPAATPDTGPSPSTPVAQTPAAVIERGTPVWPWIVGIIALVVVARLILKRRI